MNSTDQAAAVSSGIVGCTIKTANFDPRFPAQAAPINSHTSRRAESHLPVAVHEQAELPAAMVAAQHHHEPNVHKRTGRAR